MHTSLASGGFMEHTDRDVPALEQADPAVPGINVNLLRAMLDNVPAMIGYWDTRLCNRFANATYTRWVGKTLDEVVGRSIPELFGPEFYEKYKPHLDAVLAGERQVYTRAATSPGGEVEHQHVSYIPYIQDSQVQGFFVLTIDITDLVVVQHALEAALREKETLLKEVYHRVKNNLQVIQSLLNLQRRELPQGTARSGMQDMIQRVSAMALLHEQLYRSDNLSAVSLRRYVQDVLDQLAQANDGRGRGIALQTDLTEIAIELDSAMPLGLLLTELITNGYKHAFPPGRGGRIMVAIRPQEAGVAIIVSDDGVGFPAGFDPSKASSMGMRLAFALAQQLGGTLSFSSDRGTTARVEVPRL
jgi:PAS domain S-box-containing protein